MKISKIKEALNKLGIELSLDNIRKLEKAGIITCGRSKGRFREFSEEQFAKSMRNLLLYYFNTPIKDIKEDKPEVIAERIKLIKKALKQLT